MTVPRICCLVFARLASTRVPNKLLQEVGGPTLLERGLDYLVRLREACPNVTPIVCAPGITEFASELKMWGIERRIDPTTDAKSWPELIAPHVEMLRERFDWVWDANIFCHPFLRLETGQAIVNRMERSDQPFTVTTSTKGILWDESGELIYGRGRLANTKTNPIYHQLAHIAYCWPAGILSLNEAKLSARVQPYLMPLHWSELIDIDTPEDLEHARAVAKGAGL